MSDCVSSEKLWLFLDDQLDATSVESIAAHVNGCAHCQETLNGLTDLSGLHWNETPVSTGDTASLENQITGLIKRPPILSVRQPVLASTDLTFLSSAMNPEDMGSLLHYRIKRVLGSGGMGIVFQAYDTELMREVAVKVYRPSAESPEHKQRFLREARAVAGLRNDHIVPIHSIHGQDVPRPFMVMELVVGMSLEEELKDRNDISPNRAARICLQVTQGLMAAHEAGVIHRDVKPSNILLDNHTQRARLTDFGLARITEQVEPITQDGTLLGTVSYMSPEQIWNTESIDGRTDVYSLGVTLYEMLAGQLPFRGSVHNVVHHIRHEDPASIRTSNAKVPRDLETIVGKCMEKQPHRRYATATELGADLERFLNGQPIKARAVGRPELVWRWCRRRPLLATVVVLICFLAIAGPVAAVYQSALRARIRRMVAEDYFELAQLAGSRGKWQEATSRLDLALESGYPDPIRIQLEKINALVALGDMETAARELDTLSTQELPQEHLGTFLLIEGDLMLVRGEADGMARVEEALKYPLEKADAAYARALLADSPAESISCLEEALEYDPFHYQGNGLVVMTMIQTGRLDEALQRAMVGELVYPEDTNFRILQAVILAIQEDLPAAKAILKKSKDKLDSGQLSNLEESLQKLSQFDEILGVMDVWETGNNFADRVSTLINSQLSGWEQIRVSSSSARKGDESRFIAPVLLRIPPIFNRHNRDFQAALSKWTAGHHNEAITDVEELIAGGAHTGEIHFTHGMFLLNRHQWKTGTLVAAEQAFLKAAESNSMWPNIDREAMYTAAMCAGGALIGERKAEIQEDPDHLRRGVEHVRKRLALGPLQNAHANNLYRLSFEAEDWELCREILDDMRKRFPDKPVWHRYEIKLDYVTGYYYSAWQSATDYLNTEPGNQGALDVQRDALEKLRDPQLGKE